MKNVKQGKGVKIVQPVNLYGCTLNDYVFVGPFVEIQNNVTVGNNTRIQSHSFICSNVSIGEDCFVGHGVIFTNDKFTEKKLSRNLMPTNVGNKVYIGSNSTILPISICSDVVIGAGSVVVKDIIESGIYAGNPARKIK